MKSFPIIFLCHDSNDKAKVKELNKLLIHEQYNPWLDQKEILPGQEWDAIIQKAIKKAAIVIICLSKQSVRKRGYLNKEINWALDRQKEMLPEDIFIIPVKLDPCELPENLKNFQCCELFQAYGFIDLKNAIDHQLSRINEVIDKNPQFDPNLPGYELDISVDYLEELFYLLIEIDLPDEVLKKHFSNSLPPFYKLKMKPESISQIIELLSCIPGKSKRSLPILMFVKSITKEFKSSNESDLLEDWITRVSSGNDSIAEQELITDPMAQNSETLTTKFSKDPIHILVRLIPDRNNRNNNSQLFDVHIYAWRNPENVNEICKKKCDENNIIYIIYEAISNPEHIDGNEKIKAIEYILPYECIDFDVYAYTWNKVGLKARLTDSYQVFIRMDRYICAGYKLPRNFRDNWKEQWDKMIKTNNGRCENKSIFCVCNHENYDPEQIIEEFVSDENKTCFMQTFFPVEIQKFGLSILNAGIPVAVWCKEQGDRIKDHDEIKNYLVSLVKDFNLNTLPDSIRKLYQKSDRKKGLQDQLILLWDDPERLPIDIEQPPIFEA